MSEHAAHFDVQLQPYRSYGFFCGGMMKQLSSIAAALAFSVMMMAGATSKAKADGGAVAIGVGVYLLTDAIVGRKCHRHDWPFNIVAKIADELHGKRGCPRHGSYKDRPNHHRKYR